MKYKLRSIGDGEALEGISTWDEQHEVRTRKEGEKQGVPKEGKVLARVASIGTCRVVDAALFEILDREI